MSDEDLARAVLRSFVTVEAKGEPAVIQRLARDRDFQWWCQVAGVDADAASQAIARAARRARAAEGSSDGG